MNMVFRPRGKFEVLFSCTVRHRLFPAWYCAFGMLLSISCLPAFSTPTVSFACLLIALMIGLFSNSAVMCYVPKSTQYLMQRACAYFSIVLFAGMLFYTWHLVRIADDLLWYPGAIINRLSREHVFYGNGWHLLPALVLAIALLGFYVGSFFLALLLSRKSITADPVSWGDKGVLEFGVQETGYAIEVRGKSDAGS